VSFAGVSKPVVTTLYKITSNGSTSLRQDRYQFRQGCLEFTPLVLEDRGLYSFMTALKQLSN
jgi:hypothetical protein